MQPGPRSEAPSRRPGAGVRTEGSGSPGTAGDPARPPAAGGGREHTKAPVLPAQSRRSSARARSLQGPPPLCAPLAPAGARGTSEVGTPSGPGRTAVLKLQTSTSPGKAAEGKRPPWAPGSSTPTWSRPPGDTGPSFLWGSSRLGPVPVVGPLTSPAWTPLLSERRSAPSALSPAGRGAGARPAGARGSKMSHEQRREEQPLGRPSRVGAQDAGSLLRGLSPGCSTALQGPQRAPQLSALSGTGVEGWWPRQAHRHSSPLLVTAEIACCHPPSVMHPPGSNDIKDP